MFNMIVRMSLITILYVVLTAMLEIWLSGSKPSKRGKIKIGIIYGICCILSTHFGVDYIHMMLNVRDLGPLIAGLFFDPLSGVIAGMIGGIERYIAGTYLGVGSYTVIACSVSTCLAGFIALFLRIWVFKDKRPKPVYLFFVGAVMEVFHMYAVIITHKDDIEKAFSVVDVCSAPMILFTAIGLAATSIVILVYNEEWENPFKKKKSSEIRMSELIQRSLFLVMIAFTIINLLGASYVQTETAYQRTKTTLENGLDTLEAYYNSETRGLRVIKIGQEGKCLIYNHINGRIIYGFHTYDKFSSNKIQYIDSNLDKKYFKLECFGDDYIVAARKYDDEKTLLVMIPTEEVFFYRNVQGYETGFAAILLFALVFLLISLIVDQMVVKNIERVNISLAKITGGDLDEVVNVRNSIEFDTLSDDINMTVNALKDYIVEAEKRMEQDLELANNIQQSSLPKNFKFSNRDEFELYANMHAAKSVGGDFYDFFFVDADKIALVIADVSGKGIPGALFMMKAKTAIRGFAGTSISPGEILEKANVALCEGNEADMFVTVWLAVVDLKTGVARCANYGHEFPVIMRKGCDYEIYKDNHSLPLATFEMTKTKEYVIKLNPGDRIFVYTDGIPEAINRENEQYGLDRMLDVLNNNKSESFDRLLHKVGYSIRDFANGTEQFDDITMLIFELIKTSDSDK